MSNNLRLVPDFNTIPIEDISFNNRHYYSIQQDIVNLFGDYVKEKKYNNILEIGPLTSPIPYATHTIDINRPSDNINLCIDIDTQIMPVHDKCFDFGYARHVFEDIQNPDFAFKEMQRTCKEFYIETPSPLVEMLKNIDYSNAEYRGYIHHRYFIWSIGNTIYCLPKYPIVEHLQVQTSFENKLKYIANNYPVSWNNYILCNENTQIVMLKNEINFSFQKDTNYYAHLILNGITQSLENTSNFIPKLMNGSF